MSPAGPPGEPPPVAATVFGDRLTLARRYAAWLTDAGVTRGLLGPAEPARLWARHLLNCAVLADLVPPGATVVDIGSGAGLPGLALAIRRPDLTVTLLEPMARRAAFLTEVVADLALAQVRVQRTRAEDAARGQADVVTARAVAPLTRLVTLCMPLTTESGSLLAMKGDAAPAELAAASVVLRQENAAAEIVRVDLPDGAAGATVVRVVRQPRAPRRDRGTSTRREPR